MKTFKVLAAMLDYPEQALIDAVPELAEALDAEGLLRKPERAALDELFAVFHGSETMALQERYVDLFDRVRSLSLHLFEHVHGESRDRGQALVDLNRLYSRHGFELASNELPDYLPAMLEYLSRRPLAEAREMLADAAHILGAIGARLEKRRSAYAAVFRVLVALSGEKVYRPEIDDAEVRAEDDPAALDKLWAEAPAFGPGSKGCDGGAKRNPMVSPVKFYKGAAA